MFKVIFKIIVTLCNAPYSIKKHISLKNQLNIIDFHQKIQKKERKNDTFYKRYYLCYYNDAINLKKNAKNIFKKVENAL